ncbi:MAG: DNA polymerase III subunit gamma/tau [Moorellales bacterium]
MYVALYRRWRPQTFSAVVGQAHVTRALRESLRRGRLAHAYLFSGPRGTGKTSTAKIFAKALNCLAPADGEPCNRCANCEAINTGAFLDILEIDAASHRRIDDVRELQERLPFGPVQGRYKVYIVDEVHMLTPEAFNALLKTLEEPPAHVIFVLATTEPQKIPPTVLSRCLRFDFRPLGPQEISRFLLEVARASGLELEERAAWAVARMARGALRDALSLLEECAAYAGNRLTEEDVRTVLGLLPEEALLALGEALWRGDQGRVLELLQEAWTRGKQAPEVVRELLSYLRDLLAVKFCPERADLLLLSPASHPQLREQARLAAAERIYAAARVLAEVETQLRLTGQPEVLVELALLEASEPQSGAATAPAEVAGRDEAPAGAGVTESEAVVTRAAPPPEPEPPATRPEPSSGGLVAVESLAWWPRVLEATRRAPKVRALLGGVKAVAERGDTLVLGVTAEFYREELDKPANRAAVREVLARIRGRRLEPEPVVLSAGPDGPAGAPERKPDPKEKERAVLDEALRLFGGRVVDHWEENGE